jgi:hypothetical protein
MIEKLANEFYHSPTTILPLLIKSKLDSLPWKHSKVRAEIIRDLVESYGINDDLDGTKHVGWSIHDLIKFTKPLLEHTNPLVRESAASLMAMVGQKIGPENLKPLLDKTRKASIQNVSDKIDNLKGSRGSLVSTKKTKTRESSIIF